MSGQFSLAGKVIIITGGTGILGEAFVHAVVDAGGAVGILGRNEKRAVERAEAINSAGGNALALIADVQEENQVREARDKAMAHFGKIDGLVNGAGGNMPEGVLEPDADIFSMSVPGMRKVMDLNLWGTVIPTQIFGASMGKEDKASIVNISSMNAMRTVTRVLGYSMGKAAVDSYTRWMAVELAHRYGDRIRVNSIAPGFFLTEQNKNLHMKPGGGYTERGASVIRQTPFRRFGEPDELKGALIWLLSDAAEFVTGATICVDGGFSIFSGV